MENSIGGDAVPLAASRADMTYFSDIISLQRHFSKICKHHGLKNPGIILPPITADYITWHNREFPAMIYPTIRNRLSKMCRTLGITLIDLGDPLANRDLFRDFLHLSPQGSQYVTGLLSEKLSPVVHAKR